MICKVVQQTFSESERTAIGGLVEWLYEGGGIVAKRKDARICQSLWTQQKVV
jgi:hypothetical protein